MSGEHEPTRTLPVPTGHMRAERVESTGTYLHVLVGLHVSTCSYIQLPTRTSRQVATLSD